MELITIRFFLVFFALLVGISGIVRGQTSNDKAVKLEVVSVRLMTRSEIDRRFKDVIGLDIVVRFRLSNAGSKGVYYSAAKGDTSPEGNALRKTEKGRVWLIGNKESETSPGMCNGSGNCDWLLLSEGSAVEWESFDMTTNNGKSHGVSVFIKKGFDGEPKEIFSPLYVVPSR